MTAFVIVVMTAVSIPVLTPRYQAYQMRSAAWQVAGDMRLARQRAVTTRVCYRFAFADTTAASDPNSYVIQHATPGGCSDPWIQEIPAGQGMRQRLAGAIHIDPSSTSTSGNITFYPNGRVFGGTIRLTGPGGAVRTVTVDSVGRVQVD